MDQVYQTTTYHEVGFLENSHSGFHAYRETIEMLLKIKPSTQKRVELSEDILKNLIEKISDGKVSGLAREVGLSYGVVYNLVHGRVNSLSVEDYKRIFGEDPPQQAPKRVDGSYFRGMVRLWTSLHDSNEADLYKKFNEGKYFKKNDYRIFSGKTKTVESRLEKMLEQKYFDLGIKRSEIIKMIYENDESEEEERVSYEEIKPLTDFISRKLSVSPSRILNQDFARYESGELKTVPKKIYSDAEELMKKTEAAFNSGSKLAIEKLREEIYGKKQGLTLFFEVEEDLDFLKRYGGKSPRNYLGRSVNHYRLSKLKRIASWRVRKIKNDCLALIRKNPELALRSLPNPYLTCWNISNSGIL